MKRNRTLFILIFCLATLNVGLIYLHYFSSSHSHGKGDDAMHSWLDKNLGLTDEQETQHLKMRKSYFDELRILNDTLRNIKARFVSQAAQTELTDSMSTMWTDSINRWYRRANELTYRHVRNVRAILTADQQPVWDSLIQVIMLRKSRE